MTDQQQLHLFRDEFLVLKIKIFKFNLGVILAKIEVIRFTSSLL